MSDLDPLDIRLLDALHRNARSTYAELGAGVGLKAPAVHERVRRLEERGYLLGYRASVDTRRMGYELVGFVSAFTAPECSYDDFVTAVSALPEVQEIHSVAGDETFLVKVLTRSTAHLDDLLSRLKKIAGIQRTRTTIVLSTPFERTGLPYESV